MYDLIIGQICESLPLSCWVPSADMRMRGDQLSANPNSLPSPLSNEGNKLTNIRGLGMLQKDE